MYELYSYLKVIHPRCVSHTTIKTILQSVKHNTCFISTNIYMFQLTSSQNRYVHVRGKVKFTTAIL